MKYLDSNISNSTNAVVIFEERVVICANKCAQGHTLFI